MKNFIEKIIESNKEKAEDYIAKQIVNYLLNLINEGDIHSSLFKEATQDIKDQKLEKQEERLILLSTIDRLSFLFRNLKHDAIYQKRNLSIEQILVMKKIKASYCVAYVKLCLLHKDELRYTVRSFTEFIES